jgi:hypothetical protein
MNRSKDPRIVFRNWGKTPRKHQVILKHLTEDQKKFLFDNEYIKFLPKEHQLFSILFRINYMERMLKGEKIFKPNLYTGEFTNQRQIAKDSNLVDWNCAICKVEIVSKMNDFEPKNFLCEKCKESHSDTTFIDSRIKESSILFTQKCKGELKSEQKEFLRYLKKNI